MTSSRGNIVLLHGLGRTERSMTGLRRYLDTNGYNTWARTYPSRRLGVSGLAETVAGWIRDEFGDKPVIGITHSLGGVLARHIGDAVNWSSLIMLAPPNRGSRVAAAFQELQLYRWMFGPAGQDVADADGWPMPSSPFAVIAGTAGVTLGNISSWLIGSLKIIPPGVPHDGTVTTEETRLEGMVAYAEVKASHTWLMNHPETRELIVRFLETRSFDATANAKIS